MAKVVYVVVCYIIFLFVSCARTTFQEVVRNTQSSLKMRNKLSNYLSIIYSLEIYPMAYATSE